jgi:hypothetical protein
MQMFMCHRFAALLLQFGHLVRLVTLLCAVAVVVSGGGVLQFCTCAYLVLVRVSSSNMCFVLLHQGLYDMLCAAAADVGDGRRCGVGAGHQLDTLVSPACLLWDSGGQGGAARDVEYL